MSATVEKITYTSTPEQVAAMHAAFDRALDEVEAGFGQTYPMVIDGEERTAAETFETHAPANRDLLLGRFQSGTAQDVDDAVAAARAAYPGWSGMDWRERVRGTHRGPMR